MGMPASARKAIDRMHSLAPTEQDEFNADLLTFIKR